jgi:drug/metabolite transporter (DMT)-like permease
VERRRVVGLGLVVLSAIGFGSGSLFAKTVYPTGVDWLVLSAWRFGIGAALAWAWLLGSRSRRRGLARLDRRSVAMSVLLGTFYVGNSGTYFAGLETVSASLSALIVYVYPALVAVLSLRIGRALTGRRAWTALALALSGVALAVGGLDRATAPPIQGLLLVMASPVIYSGWIILAARLSGERRHQVGDEERSGADAAAASALMMTSTALIYWAVNLVAGRPVLPGAIPVGAWPGLIGLGAMATFVAIQAFYAGARRIGAAQAALVSTVEPIWTIVLAAILFAESLTPVQLVGGALIVAGVILAQSARGGTTAAELRLADE